MLINWSTALKSRSITLKTSSKPLILHRQNGTWQKIRTVKLLPSVTVRILAAAYGPIHVRPLPSPKQQTLRHCGPTDRWHFILGRRGLRRGGAEWTTQGKVYGQGAWATYGRYVNDKRVHVIASSWRVNLELWESFLLISMCCCTDIYRQDGVYITW